MIDGEQNFLLNSMTLQKLGQNGRSAEGLVQRMRDIEGRSVVELSHLFQDLWHTIRQADMTPAAKDESPQRLDLSTYGPYVCK